MSPSLPLLTSNSATLWLKVLLTAAALIYVVLRYRNRSTWPSPQSYPLRAKVILGFAVVLSFAAFHNLGKPRSGTFVHYGEMFHYYLGPKYFKELGYFELYNAVIAADAEQGNALAGLPFYTDLTTYQNVPREKALGQADRVKSRFSQQRWDTFKEDVAYFKEQTGLPRSSAFYIVLMDHGYNASPVTTSALGVLTNLLPVTQLRSLAMLDVLLVLATIAVVFRTFGFEMGALFSIYFFVNILNDPGYTSGGLLRYDWLCCLVLAVCLLEKGRQATSACFLTLSAMIRFFPMLLFYGIGVDIFRRVKTARTLDGQSKRFVVAAAVTALALFLLPTVYLGSGLQPWKDFFSKAALHDSGVYVNHLGLRGIVLFEPSHLSLNSFVRTFSTPYTNDVVRHWQDIKEMEFKHKTPLIALAALIVLVAVTAIIWRGRGGDGARGGLIWPLVLVYTATYASHYYYAFLCLFVLLFFGRPNTLSSAVPIGLLFLLNLAALVTDSFSPSPIVFYTLANIYLFVCVTSILGFELCANVLGKGAQELDASSVSTRNVPVKRGRNKRSLKPARRV